MTGLLIVIPIDKLFFLAADKSIPWYVYAAVISSAAVVVIVAVIAIVSVRCVNSKRKRKKYRCHGARVTRPQPRVEANQLNENKVLSFANAAYESAYKGDHK